MKWYKYLFFYCLVFFCFSCNVFGIKIANEPYIKDCKGNVVSKVENKKGNDNTNSDTNNCSVDLNKNIVYSERDDQIPNSCKPEPTNEEKARSILLLIDNSYSMYDENDNWKVEEVKRIFKSIAKEMEQNDKLYIKYFKKVWEDNKCSDCERGCGYSQSEVDTEQKRKNIAKQILKYSAKDKTCTTPLCYGTNTYSVRALEKASDFVENKVSKTVPIVIFITDGYPTSFTNTRGTKFDLGYLSSARHFYKFAVEMKNLKEKFEGLTTKQNGNSYIKDGIYSPKFVTIGLGVDNNQNFAAKYLLNTDKDTLDELNVHKNGDTSTKQRYREDSKFYNMLNTSKGDDKYEITASIASNPDLGVAGALPNKNDRKITFSADALSIIKKTNGEVAFGPIKTSSIETVKYFKKSGRRCIQTTDNPSGWLKRLSGGYDNFSVITIPYNSCLLDHEVTINLKEKVDNSLKKYHSGKTIIGKSLNGFVSEYYGKTNGNSVKVPEIQKILKYENDSAKPTTTQIHVERYTHNGINSDIKYKYLGTGYVRHCASLTTSGQSCTPTKVAVYAKYFIDYTIKFNGGTLKDNSTSISPGTGFQFQDLQTTVDGIWYYTGYADTEKQVPIIEYRVNSDSDKYDINYNSVYKDKDLTIPFIAAPQDLWKQIDKSVQSEQISFESKYTTIDSNDNTNKDISKQIDSNTSFDINFPTVNDHDTHYVTTKTDSIKKSCIKDTSFKYIDNNKSCSDGYTETDSYSTEKNSYIRSGDRYYFIPFNYNENDVNVKIDFNVVGKKFSTTCKINVHNNASPCSDDNKKPSTIEEQVSYRSIDKDNPFPRADNKYYSIPLNWRSWYCDGSISKVTCAVKGQNQRRLINSYSGGPYYSKQYKSQDLTQIANDTRDNSKNYYSSWANIDQSGNSSSIGSDSTDIIDKKFGSNINSYCHLGSFKSECDGVMNK